jgi:ferredoxin-NADP reductase
MLFTLREKRHEIADVWSFIFDPPEPFWWKAGQYLHYELPHENEDDEGAERWFTIASAPYEGRVQVTTRITESTFKKALASLNQGDQITAYGLEGDFLWPEGETTAVFVAAGIGITPYHSMLKQRLHSGRPTPVTLVYGNRTNEITFKDELDRWSVEHPELQVYYKVGVRIGAESLKEILPDITERLVYLSGPEPMVIGLSDELSGIGISEERIVRDEFPGYDESNY